MRESHFELSVGESILIEDRVLTVLDIHDGEITFRLDTADDVDAGEVLCGIAEKRPPR